MPEPANFPVFRSRRELLLHRLRRLDEALVRWDEFAANAALPAELPREMPAPRMLRVTLESARQVAMERLIERKLEWERRN